MLGHALLGVMSVYNKHDWLEDQRAAYELWWSVLQRELGVAVSPVMAINPRHDV